MGKSKLRRFAENETFENLFQPAMADVMGGDFHLKGAWRSRYFKNSHPVVLELGCGRGEYTVGLAKLFPERNFIGVDIKGARLWRGAKTAVEERMGNVAFIRTRIECIASFFAPEEVDEVWITFPDPQPREKKWRKRLTSSRFLNHYAKFLKPNGTIHLKTDSQDLHAYTKALAERNHLAITACTTDLYATAPDNPALGIKTHYEQLFAEKGFAITYIRFQLNQPGPFDEPDIQDV